jgi:hypothetical protein
VYWFLYLVVVAALAAHVATGAMIHDTVDLRSVDGLRIFHTVALTAFAGYSLALWQLSIWYRRAWSTTLKSTFDALIYAVITGATFMWLWPR